LKKGQDYKKLEAKFPGMVEKYMGPQIQQGMNMSLSQFRTKGNELGFTLQPLTDIHLHSHTKYEMEPNGEMQYVYIFSALAVFILLLACINFTNLSTARSIKRAKEVGVRKVMGSLKLQLIKQFLSESVLMSFCAMMIALLFIFLLLPYYNALSGKSISFVSLFSYRSVTALLAIVLFVGILSGIYPSFFLSSFNPINAFKGAVTTNKKTSLRNVLIVFQFFISTALVTATIIIYTQLNYLQNKKLGYDKEQVLFIPDASLLGNNQEAFKQELLQDNRVVTATISRSIPGDPFMGGTQIYPKNDNGNGQEIHTNIYNVDYDYLRTLGNTIK
jgi:putative ABC transport system permease protein